MKTLVAIVALATVIAAPAFAQSGKHARTQAYAQQHQRQQPQAPRYSTNPAHDVFVNGQYVGSDPDPMIRAQLQRDVDNGD